MNWRINREVNAEDTRLIKWVQEGMQTSAFQSGPLAKSEICLIDSAEKINKAIPIATLDQEPATEDMQALNRELSSRMDRI